MPEPSSSVLPPLLASPFSVSLRPLLGFAAVLCGVVTGAVYGAPALNVTRASSFHLLFVWTFPYVWCRLVQPLFPQPLSARNAGASAPPLPQPQPQHGPLDLLLRRLRTASGLFCTALFFALMILSTLAAYAGIGRIVPTASSPVFDPPAWTVWGFTGFGVAIQLLWITLVADALLMAWTAARGWLRRRRGAGSVVKDAPAPPAAAPPAAAVVTVDDHDHDHDDPPAPRQPATSSSVFCHIPPPSLAARLRRAAFTAATCSCAAFPLPVALAVLACVLLSSASGTVAGHSPPLVVRTTIPLARLPPALSGFRLVALTDTHVGAAIGGTRLQVAVALALAAQPDAVALVGDIIDGDEEVFWPALEPLRALAARCNASNNSSPSPPAAAAARRCAGVFFVSGNHEIDAGTLARKEAIFRAMGIRVLKNERVELGFGYVSSMGAPPPSPPTAGTVDLVGVPDWATSAAQGPGQGHNLAAAVAGRDTSRELVVLAHQPHAGDAGAGLMVAGHVHGGQMTPVHAVAAAGNLYYRGLYAHTVGETHASNPQRMWVYVSFGTYQWGPIFRQAAQHEVSVLELVVAP
jgi:predicted MPP superfamily phosphohydrolase